MKNINETITIDAHKYDTHLDKLVQKLDILVSAIFSVIADVSFKSKEKTAIQIIGDNII